MRLRVSMVFQIAGVALLLGVLAPAALAVSKYYEISGGSVNGNFADPGLVINTSLAPGLSGTSFILNDGGSSSFNFFNVWTNETTVNSDDLVAMNISATLNFSDPLTGATVNGVTFGGSVIFGLAQWGQIQWNGPTTITLGDREFSLALSNEVFNPGVFGLSGGQGCGAMVKATVTQILSSGASTTGTSVPDNGSTAMLLGVAVTGLLISRKRMAS